MISRLDPSRAERMTLEQAILPEEDPLGRFGLQDPVGHEHDQIPRPERDRCTHREVAGCSSIPRGMVELLSSALTSPAASRTYPGG